MELKGSVRMVSFNKGNTPWKSGVMRIFCQGKWKIGIRFLCQQQDQFTWPLKNNVRKVTYRGSHFWLELRSNEGSVRMTQFTKGDASKFKEFIEAINNDQIPLEHNNVPTSALKKTLQELIECGICLDPMVDPRVLSCQHSFCAKCLINLFSHSDIPVFTCPTCRRDTPIPERGVHDLPHDFKVNTLSAFMKESEKDQDKNKADDEGASCSDNPSNSNDDSSAPDRDLTVSRILDLVDKLDGTKTRIMRDILTMMFPPKV